VVLDRPAHLPDGFVPDDDVKLDETLLHMAHLRVLGAALGLQHVLVRGDEARLTFRPGTQPRLTGLTSALDDVQLAAEVRRTVPLSLRLVRLGGEPIVPALVRALQKAA
jgi:transcription-repair coupling factor (superfamily II helicase)